jgi:HAD superfamily hydrolase (TIGR01662 family)
MVSQIDAIFLDVGNTLRILTKNEEHQSEARRKITQLVGTQENPEAFCKKLDERYKIYRKWAFEQLSEAPEAEIWTRWLAPEFPTEYITRNAVELTYQYRQSLGLRVMVPNGKEVIIELHRRGYTLGIISNVITSQEIPDWLEADGLSQYFQSVILSSVLGIRKPDPAIYLEAARRAGVDPQHCVYVGDNLKRDITGTRKAGFGMVVIMLLDPQESKPEENASEDQPDLIIHQFRELLDIFPARSQAVVSHPMGLNV